MSGLKILHLNIRSLRNSAHLLQLRELTNNRKFDIITISETWLNTTVTSGEVGIDGYKLFRLDRLHKSGGGVCAYVRKELKTKVLKDFSYISDRNFHQLWISVQLRKLKSILVCIVYRPVDCPLSFFEDTLKPNYTQALALNKPIVILGDLNCDGLNVNCIGYKAMSKFLVEMNLKQTVNAPTRITATTSSLLDVILVSSPSLVRSSGVINMPISDHLPVYAELKVKIPKPLPYTISTRSYKNYNSNLFSSDLASNADDLLSIFNGSDVNAKLDTFNTFFLSTLDSHAPIKTIKIRNRPCPFVTSEIRQLIKSKKSLHRRFLQSRDESDWANYKVSCTIVKRSLVDAERKHTFHEVQQNKDNPSSLWRIIKRLVPSKEKERKVYTRDHKTVADDFNMFFSSVGRNATASALQLAEEHNLSLSNFAL